MTTRLGIQIEAAMVGDISTILNIHRACIERSNAKYYPSQAIVEWVYQVTESAVLDQFGNSTWLVIKSDGEIKGFCQYSIDKKAVYQIQIHPKYQKKGYGKDLYSYIEKDFLDHGVVRINLNSTLQAVPFYTGLGFKSIQRINYPLDKQNIILEEMIKELG